MELLRWFVDGLRSLLQVYFGLWMQLGVAIREGLGLAMPAGVMDAIAIIVGFLLLAGGFVRMFRWNRKGNKPQTITLYTTQTPNQVVASDIAGFFRLVVTAVVVGIAVAILISTVTPPP